MAQVAAQKSVAKSLPGKGLALVKEMARNKTSYFFMLPFLLLFLVFTVAPVLTSFVLSFTYYNILEKPRWVGMSNYRLLFVDDDVFLIAIANTLKFAVITGPVSYAMAFLLAWLISQIPVKYRFIYTFFYYTPAITSAIAMSVVWTYLFSGDRYGLINEWLIRLGILNEPFQWLQDIRTIMPVLIIVSLWMSMGISFLSFLAGLQNVSKDLYEAGAIDGVKYRWQQLWYITIPSVKPQLLFGAVMQIVFSLQVFDVSVQLAGMPSPLYAGHTIMTHLFDYAFIRFEMGYATSIAVVLFLMMVGLNRIVFKVLGSKE